MKQTTHYKLYKPEGKDSFNIDYENSNMDTIDATMKRIESNVALNNIKLNITTDSKLVGRTITIDNGTYTYTETIPSSMKVVVNVPETGTWIIHNPVTGRDKEVICKYLGEYDVDLRCYTVYSAIIDHTILDPRDCVTYADDAEGMEKGNYEQWYNAPIFKDIKNCILVNGVFQGYLNRDNVAIYDNGNNANISSYVNEVMVEFPRMGYRLKWLNDTQLLVSVTDEPNNNEFEYGAFSLDSYNDCDKIYIGTYLSCKINDKHYSSYGGTIHINEHMLYCMQDARARGTGFQFMNFRQLSLIQCLYIIFFGDLNSQSTVGYGKANSSPGPTTTSGETNTYGFMSERIRETNLTYMTDGAHKVKCFGLEDLWGNYRYIVAGIGSENYNLMLVPYASAQSSLDSNWSSWDNWTNYGSYNHINSNMGGFLRFPIGDNHGAFLPKDASGSGTTSYCDYSSFNTGSYCTAGGHYVEGDYAGIFGLWGESGGNGGHLGFRLAYFHKENS